MKSPAVVERLYVRYRDLDPLGHVNNSLCLEYFEAVRFAYFWELARRIGITELVAGDIPGAQYVVAETTVRYKTPIRFGDDLIGGANVLTVGNRSFTMEFELRIGESLESETVAAEGSAAHVFYDSVADQVQSRPDWFLPAVAELEGRPEESFAPEKR